MTKISDYVFKKELRKFTGLMDFIQDIRKSINLTMTAQVAKAEYTAQAAALSSTVLYTPDTKWTFRVSVYMICTKAGTAGTLSCTIGWTDAAGAKTVKPAADVTLDDIANGSTGSEFILANASDITFETAITGGSGDPEYDIHILLEQMG
jgi:hypothetical protein